MINCTCALMITPQLKDQLPGGKYYNLSQSVRDDLEYCPSTNIVSERDFCSVRSKTKTKTHNLYNFGLWTYNVHQQQNKWLVELQLQRRTKRKEKILTFKMDKIEKMKLEKELNLQKATDEKEYLTQKIMKVRGLVTSSKKICKLINENNEADLKNIIKYQILFRRIVFCQKLCDKKIFQMSETSNNKYQPYCLEKL